MKRNERFSRERQSEDKYEISLPLCVVITARDLKLVNTKLGKVILTKKLLGPVAHNPTYLNRNTFQPTYTHSTSSSLTGISVSLFKYTSSLTDSIHM
jgi:hypothetical protein